MAFQSSTEKYVKVQSLAPVRTSSYMAARVFILVRYATLSVRQRVKNEEKRDLGGIKMPISNNPEAIYQRAMGFREIYHTR